MTARHAVVSGASIAGLSAAFWLRSTGWEVSVIERAPQFRDGGQNVDVRGVARQVLERMHLVDAVRAQNTTETGAVLVDATGRVTARLPSDGVDGATAELEILRGDFARTLLEHLPHGVELVWGDTIDTVDDPTVDPFGKEPHGPVVVTTTAGRTLEADLVVVAEGVRSTTRDRLFAGEVEEHELGVTMVFGTIPRTAEDDDQWRWHNATRGRQIHLRPDNHGTTRAILAYAPADPGLGVDREQQLARTRRRYEGAGWETSRILDGFDQSDDVYVDQLTQITMPTWHRGRVVVIGDAAWCVTPMGGGGASLALTSGYVLAAYLASRPDDTEAALVRFEEWMRPLVDDVQQLPRGIVSFAYPQTRLGLALRGVIDKVIMSALMKPLAARLTQVADTEQPLPPLPVGA